MIVYANTIVENDKIHYKKEKRWFLVRFNHKSHIKNHNFRRYTECKIYYLNEYSINCDNENVIFEGNFESSICGKMKKYLIAESMSECSNEDNFNKTFGCLLALKRALNKVIKSDNYLKENNIPIFYNETYKDIIKEFNKIHKSKIKSAIKLMKTPGYIEI